MCYDAHEAILQTTTTHSLCVAMCPCHSRNYTCLKLSFTAKIAAGCSLGRDAAAKAWVET